MVIGDDWYWLMMLGSWPRPPLLSILKRSARQATKQPSKRAPFRAAGRWKYLGQLAVFETG